MVSLRILYPVRQSEWAQRPGCVLEHAWLITSGIPAVSAHVVVDGDASQGPLLDRLCDCLRVDFGIEHSTFQVEPATHRRARARRPRLS